jgi:serine/threonine protein phosphatase 1
MLEWMMEAPDNVDFLMGNHDKKFIEDVDLLCKCNEDEPKIKDAYMLASGEGWRGFDIYHTIIKLITGYNIRVLKFKEWADRMKTFPYTRELNVNGRDYIIVHAGYPDMEKVHEDIDDTSLEYFYLCAREAAVTFGGRADTTIISGHTPTVLRDSIFYNKGRVKKVVDESRNCIFYDIDCGCVFRSRHEDARLACIRLDDEEIFYI